VSPKNHHGLQSSSSSSCHSTDPECWPLGNSQFTSGPFVTPPQAPINPLSAVSSTPYNNSSDWLIDATSQPPSLSANTFPNFDPALNHNAEDFLLYDSNFPDISTVNVGDSDALGPHYDGGFYHAIGQDDQFSYSQPSLQPPPVETSNYTDMSTIPETPNSSNCDNSTIPSRVEKRKQNTLAARRYRQKRVDQMKQLETALREVQVERDALKVRVARLEGETETLKQLLQGQK